MFVKRLLLVCTLSLLSAQAVDDFPLRLRDFDMAYQPMVQKYCHWSELNPPDVICKVDLGVLDYAQFRKARQQAKKLFDLEEPRR